MNDDDQTCEIKGNSLYKNNNYIFSYSEYY